MELKILLLLIILTISEEASGSPVGKVVGGGRGKKVEKSSCKLKGDRV